MAEISKERAEPPMPEPVTVEAVRYEPLLWGKARGLEQNGGYIEAFDAQTDESLWILKVYDVDYSIDMEDDKLDVFIEALGADADGILTVVNEQGRRYRIDPRDRSMREVANQRRGAESRQLSSPDQASVSGP